MKANNSFLDLVNYYTSEKRIKSYYDYLEIGLKKGFKYCSVIDSIKEIEKNTKKLICLRHDVDQKSPGALKMAKIEKDLGIKSTFYFRISTAEEKTIDKIKLMGHEVSYHYETIAEYIKKKEIKSLKDLKKLDYLNECQNMLNENLYLFRKKYSVECKTLASHGAFENKILVISNNSLFQDIENLKEILNVKLECYDLNYLSNWNKYVSDCPVEYNNGFRYGINPLESFGEDRIIFLSHPNHWSFTFLKRIKRLIKVSIKGMEIKEEKFFYQNNLKK